ncbi:serine/threonine-protein kinase [Mycolicibacterium palauense]|uniref:serine/threonine-protein kinase n=1 Tax=Mycolicibacterium palauense TaxID=2034511 RepID=UPI000BFEEB95|nr:serine/threonine-protein kinase [Mycolicibacterium palauense]
MPLADGATFAGYTIIRLLGAGGMGEVYLAQHPRLPRRDALKVLTASVTTDDEYRERFEREADIVGSLWHPHIVGVHDRGEADGQLWISMDYVEGTDAAELLRRHPEGLPPNEVVEIVTAVAQALDYAHDRRLLHRDVKPANILIAHPDTDQQRVLLADFGIARREDDTSGLTATNMTVGTVAYAAPEQLMGQDLDGRADQYALAATAFHLLTGAPPFQHSNPAVVISQHLTASPPKLGKRRPDLAHLDQALSKAMSKNPAERFARCVDFARALAHQIGTGLPFDSGAMEQTRMAAVTEPGVRRHSHRAAGPTRQRPVWLKPVVLLPVVLGILLIAAVAFAVGEFTGDRDAVASLDSSTTTPSRTASMPPPPPAPLPPSSPATEIITTVVTTEPTEPTTEPTTGDTVVVGANCAEPGATGVTADGTRAYCANLQYTDRYLWSVSPGEIRNPVWTTPPGGPVAADDESPVRICMEQTGHSRLRCAEEILRGNAG